MSSRVVRPVKWRSTGVRLIRCLSRFCFLLLMLPDIPLLTVIFIPISEWCFLPPDTTSLIQPMDQAFWQLLRPIICGYLCPGYCCNRGRNWIQFLNDYNICDCIQNLAWAWDDVSKQLMNGIWKETLKRFVPDFNIFAKDEWLQKSTRLWLRWQTAFAWAWGRMALLTS